MSWSSFLDKNGGKSVRLSRALTPEAETDGTVDQRGVPQMEINQVPGFRGKMKGIIGLVKLPLSKTLKRAVSALFRAMLVMV